MRKIRYIVKSVVIALVLLSFPVGAAKYFTLYLTNGTKYYLDIWTWDYDCTYLPPGGTVVIETAREKIDVYVYFSAGQDISDAVHRTFYTSYPDPYRIGTDCDGRRTYYGRRRGCSGREILEIESGSDTEARWTITLEDFFPPDDDFDYEPVPD